MAASFTERKMLWLEKVASDPDMQRLAIAIAVKLATRYFNSKTGQAWPSIERLADELGVDQRSVHRATKSLVKGGWLTKQKGGHGRGDTNRYWMSGSSLVDEVKGGVHAALNTRKRAAHVTEKGGVRDLKRAAHTPPDSVSEPVKEPVRSARPTKPPNSSSRQTGREKRSSSPRRTSFPDNWVFGPAEAKIALAALVRWKQVRAEQEFEKFRRYHLKNSNWRPNWLAAWESWCEKGARFGQSDHPRKTDKVADAVSGTVNWRQRQQEAARRVNGGKETED